MKKTATRKTPKKPHKRAQRAVEAPFGLTLLFSLLRADNTSADVGATYAERTLPVARAIIADLYSGEYLAPEPRAHVLRSVEAVFGGPLPEPEWVTEPSHVAETGFLIGVATAWLLMQGVNGHQVTPAGGAR